MRIRVSSEDSDVKESVTKSDEAKELRVQNAERADEVTGKDEG
jgi:hypothetical protein